MNKALCATQTRVRSLEHIARWLRAWVVTCSTVQLEYTAWGELCLDRIPATSVSILFSFFLSTKLKIHLTKNITTMLNTNKLLKPVTISKDMKSITTILKVRKIIHLTVSKIWIQMVIKASHRWALILQLYLCHTKRSLQHT